MNNDNSPYRSYLLRLWANGSGGRLTWHASLEAPKTGERIGFGTLERLLDFLREQHSDDPNERNSHDGPA